MTSIQPKQPGIGSKPNHLSGPRCLNKAEAQLVRSLSSLLKELQGPQEKKGARGDCFHSPRASANTCQPQSKRCATAAPKRQDSCHPQGSLKTDKQGVVTTPGGYKIEATSQFEWKVTGPDGKSTRVWGDPHVAEGDGGTWDFKRDSTFMLGDGTRINVTTAPYGNGMTVSAGLEVISGNDRVEIADLDKGKGKTGKVTHDGFQRANAFGGKDVFVMGRETDDWSFQGKEITGSNNGGESFKLGKDLPAGRGSGRPSTQASAQSHKPGGPANKPAGVLPGEPMPGKKPQSFLQQMQGVFQGLSGLFGALSPIPGPFQALSGLFGGLSQLAGPRGQGQAGSTPPDAAGPQAPWLDQRQSQLRNGFEDIGRMMDVFSRINELSRGVQQSRFHMPV